MQAFVQSVSFSGSLILVYSLQGRREDATAGVSATGGKGVSAGHFQFLPQIYFPSFLVLLFARRLG